MSHEKKEKKRKEKKIYIYSPFWLDVLKCYKNLYTKRFPENHSLKFEELVAQGLIHKGRQKES